MGQHGPELGRGVQGRLGRGLVLGLQGMHIAHVHAILRGNSTVHVSSPSAGERLARANWATTCFGALRTLQWESSS